MLKEHDSNSDMADILIVDDEIANLKLLSEILTREGYRVRPANSPRLAIESASGNPPDLMLLDVRMPDMDGFEVCTLLKQDERTRDIPILFISVLQDTKDKVRCFEAGGLDFISKPFQEEEVLARIRTQLKLRNMQRNLEEMITERTAELTKREAHYRALVDNAPVGVFNITLDGMLVFANDAMARIFDFHTAEQIIAHKPFEDLFGQKDLKRMLDQIEQHGKVINYQAESVTHAGRDIHILVSAKQVGTDIVAMAMDVTEAKLAERQLEKSENLARVLLNATTDMTHLLDEDGILLDLNDAMAEVLGETREKLIGTCVFDRFPPEAAEKRRNIIRQALLGGTSLQYEDHGTPGRIFDAHIYPLESPAGDKGKVVVFARDITESREAEQALQESETALKQKVKQMQTILDAIPAYIFAKDIDGRFLLANKAVADVFGIDAPEQVFGKTDFDYGATGEQKRAYNMIDREIIASQKGRVIPEERILRKDGTLGWFQTTKVPYHHPGYDKPAILGIAVDISDRKEAEQELQRSRDYFEHLLNSIPDAVFAVKIPDRTLEWAGDSCNVLGYDLSQYIGKTTEWLYPGPEEYQLIGILTNNAILSNSDSFITEVMVLNAKGEAIAVEINATIFRERGEPVSAIGLMRDITKRKQAERDLKLNEERLRKTQEIAHLGSWSLDLVKNQLTWSNEMYRIYGIDFGKTVSFDALLDMVHPDDRKYRKQLIVDLIDGKNIPSFSFRIIRSDGSVRYLYGMAILEIDDHGNPSRLEGTLQDVTDLKIVEMAYRESEERLKQAQAEAMNLRLDMAHLNRMMTMNELAASFAHEVNQPLGAIMNNASVAKMLNKESANEDGELTEILDDIMSDAFRAGQIIRKIRGIMHKGDVVFTSLDVNQLLDEVVGLYENTFNLNHISVVSDKGAELSPVRGDQVRLQQVLINLITNAMDTMADSPLKTLTFKTVQLEDMVQVSISDTGSGIAPEKMNHIFEPFYTTKNKGMGIGLRLCKSIIEEHGGRIWVENNPIAGATFSFSLNISRT